MYHRINSESQGHNNEHIFKNEGEDYKTSPVRGWTLVGDERVTGEGKGT
jgi:hypothetical protein